ncbi:asf1p [Saccharomyces arboricola H-6]|uniref:Histone chaperone n=1 Tax=Saccharomyces arboricola (strain H-6 / AS 2.3317 / CBS 10644) TaxID=1160507 RepID=J8Q0P7_SACAR|nr:asf1p [Saccharomyces arboricola H-6]
MSIVSLLGIKVLNNPAKFTDPYEFEITFECLESLKHDLEWKLTYVGSSRSLDHDQELDSILVGPVPVGVNKFVFSADPPSAELIPASELVSVTVILLSCSYDGREFVRVGYYVNNEYDEEELRENPPTKVQVDHIVRNILAEKPRVTRFNIVWDNENEGDLYPPEQPGVDDEEEEEDSEDDEEDDDDEDDENENEDEGNGDGEAEEAVEDDGEDEEKTEDNETNLEEEEEDIENSDGDEDEAEDEASSADRNEDENDKKRRKIEEQPVDVESAKKDGASPTN